MNCPISLTGRTGAYLGTLVIAVIAVTASEWLSHYSPAGAVPIGTAVGESSVSLPALRLGEEFDNSAELAQFIENAGPNVKLPGGTIRITRTIEIDLTRLGWKALDGGGARVLMSGPGPAFRFVGSHGGTAAPESFKKETWRERSPLIRDLEIVGAHQEADGVEARGTMQLTLSGLSIRNCRHAVHLVERNRNLLLVGCHLYDNHGVGVYYDNVNLHQSNISACHISYNRLGGVVVRGGDVRNIHISGCDIEGNMADGGPAAANVHLECGESGTVAEVAIVGCTIQHSRKPAGGANIRILGRGKVLRNGKPTEFQCGNITIADNVLSDVQQNIHLRGARGVTITGNTLWQGWTHNLLLEDSQQLVVSDNVFERNPLYGYTDEADNRLQLRDCHDSVLSGLQVHAVNHVEAGLLLENCSRINLSSGNIVDCTGPELVLQNCRNCRISDCILRDDQPRAETLPPLLVIGGSGNLISGNLFSHASVIDPQTASELGNQVTP
jgi:hypothetical protein